MIRTVPPLRQVAKAGRCATNASLTYVILTAFTFVPLQVHGSVINVAPNRVAPDDTDGFCSLVEAFENALDTFDGQPNADCAPGDSAGADTVVLATGGVYLFEQRHNATAGGNALPVVDGEVTLEANGSLLQRADGTTGFRLAYVVSSGSLTIHDALIRNGSPVGAFRQGGAIRNFGATHLVACNLEDNEGSAGGALYNVGQLNVEASTLRHNDAATSGGGILNSGGGSVVVTRSLLEMNTAGANGGAIFNNVGSTLELDATTLSANLAEGGDGGGLYAGGTVEAINCTISGNDAGDFGGGVFVAGNADAAIRFSTLAFNGNGNLDLHPDSASSVSIAGSVLAYASVGPNCLDGAGAIDDQGHNVADDGSCLNHPSSVVADPLLDTLGNYGGSTPVHALLPASPAIDLVPCDPDNGDEDQRGVPRPQGTACDSGSYELVETEITVAAAQADEDSGTLAFSVERSHNSHDVSVDVTTAPGTAQPDEDFQPISLTIFLPAGGPVIADVNVPLFADDVLEQDETLTLQLSNAVQAVLADNAATGTIVNDDAVEVSFATAFSEVTESSGLHQVSVELNGQTDIPVTAQVTDLRTGTATVDDDYLPLADDTVAFAAGSGNGTQSFVTITIVDDTADEPNESIELQLLAPVGGNVVLGAQARHEVTIIDDDQQDAVVAHLDISPNACPNTLRTKSGGFVRAAMLGSEGLDVLDLDRESVRIARSDGIGGNLKPELVRQTFVPLPVDLSGAGDGDVCDCVHPLPDGWNDAILRFAGRELTHVLELNNVPDGTSVELTMTGQLFNGASFEARDCIVVKNGNTTGFAPRNAGPPQPRAERSPRRQANTSARNGRR